MNKDEAKTQIFYILNKVDDFQDQITLLVEMFLTRVFTVRMGTIEKPEQEDEVVDLIHYLLKNMIEQSYKLLNASSDELIATVQKSKNIDIENADYYDEVSAAIKNLEKNKG